MQKRKIVQLKYLFILNSNFFNLNIRGYFCLPVLNCEACTFSWLGCPIGMISCLIASHQFPFFVLFGLLAMGFVAGRFFCGWICPFGLIQDLLYKIKSPKLLFPSSFRFVKYAILLFTVIFVAYYLGISPWLFCNFCPVATLQVKLPLVIGGCGYYFSYKTQIISFVVLIIIIFATIVDKRSFCKIICPLGALMAFTNKLSLFSLKLNKNKCIHCKTCDAECPMNIKVEEYSGKKSAINKNTECIECLICENKCPVSAISNNSSIKKEVNKK